MQRSISHEEYNAAVDDVIDMIGVLGVETVGFTDDPDEPLMRLQVGEGYDRVPPRVLRTLAAHDLGVGDVTTGEDGVFVVEVR